MLKFEDLKPSDEIRVLTKSGLNTICTKMEILAEDCILRADIDEMYLIKYDNNHAIDISSFEDEAKSKFDSEHALSIMRHGKSVVDSDGTIYELARLETVNHSLQFGVYKCHKDGDWEYVCSPHGFLDYGEGKKFRMENVE